MNMRIELTIYSLKIEISIQYTWGYQGNRLVIDEDRDITTLFLSSIEMMMISRLSPKEVICM
jgi:hypothetical protein